MRHIPCTIQLCRSNTSRIAIQRSLYSSRTFFTGGKQKEFHGRKLVGYSAEEMYVVVSDVGNYKEFVPFCKKSDIIKSSPGQAMVELTIGFPPITESYVSNVTMVRPNQVHSKGTEGHLFNFVETNWLFGPGLRSNPKSCIVDFYILFEFKSLFHSQITSMFFEKLVSQMESAFITEAKRRFGHESLPSHKLVPPKTS